MFFIIGIWGGKERIYASYKFFIYTFFGSVFFLLGIIYVVSATGETDIYLIARALKGVGLSINAEKWLWVGLFLLAIKLPMFPFHTWLPDAHVEELQLPALSTSRNTTKNGRLWNATFPLAILSFSFYFFQ